ncbi:MAG: ribosomal protein S18-alanine N-acetyltransferase [Chloroflexota bacterium]
MKLAVLPMDLEDIGQVLEVDRESYSVPWPASAYRREILHNRNARYLVLREVSDGEESSPPPEAVQRRSIPFPFLRWPARGDDRNGQQGRVIGYAGMWMMVDEAHITTVAIRNEWRGRGLGELLLASLVEAAAEMSARRVTLEVRVSNETAQNLYRKYGFRQEGIRPRYYSDDNEDAYIMSTDAVQDEAFRRRFDFLIGSLRTRLLEGRELEVAAPALHAPENLPVPGD